MLETNAKEPRTLVLNRETLRILNDPATDDRPRFMSTTDTMQMPSCATRCCDTGCLCCSANGN